MRLHQTTIDQECSHPFVSTGYGPQQRFHWCLKHRECTLTTAWFCSYRVIIPTSASLTVSIGLDFHNKDYNLVFHCYNMISPLSDQSLLFLPVNSSLKTSHPTNSRVSNKFKIQLVLFCIISKFNCQIYSKFNTFSPVIFPKFYTSALTKVISSTGLFTKDNKSPSIFTSIVTEPAPNASSLAIPGLDVSLYGHNLKEAVP